MSESEVKRAAREAAFRKLQVDAAWGTLTATMWLETPRSVARAIAILGAEDEGQLLELASDRDLWQRQLNGAERDAVWRYRGWDPVAGKPLE